jgi:hypothetical protein
MRRFVVSLVVLGLVFVAGSATASAATKARPFQGYMIGACSFVPDVASPTGMWTISDTRGDVSRLGASVMSARHPTPTGVAIDAGTMKLVAANGDEVWITYTGGFTPPGPDGILVVGLDFTITGGTGRFSAASGGGEMTGYVTFLGFDVSVWPATFVWSGATIVY